MVDKVKLSSHEYNKMMSFYCKSLALFVLVILYSCSTIKPVTPDILISTYNVPEQPISSISIPIKIDLKPYFKETNNSVPKKFTGNEQTCEGVSYSYKFYREPIKFEGKGNKLLFDVDGKFALRLNYCASCTDLFSDKGSCIVPRIYASCGVDEPMRKMHVGYATTIGLSENYKLTSETKLRVVKALSPCEITLFNYDATKTLQDEVTLALKDVEKEIDAEISAIDLKPAILDTWKLLSEQMNIDGYGILNIQPIGLSTSKVAFKGDTALLNVILEAKPIITTTDIPLQIKPLPKLKKYENRDGFDISMDVFATYDSLSHILTSTLKGTTVDISGKEVVFGDISIQGASDKQITLKVDFSGKKKGRLYLKGTPLFNAEKQHISFPDLTFDVKTKSALLKSAKWLFNDKITEAIRQSASMDLGPYLDTLKTMINQNMNMELDKNVYLKGFVKEVTITFFHPAEDKLHMRVQSKGELELAM